MPLPMPSAGSAQADFKSAIANDPSDFDAQLGLARALDMQGKYRDAYIQVDQKALPLAKTDATKAQVYYFEALYLEEIGDKLSLQGAANSWTKLIALPADVMPADWRTLAFQHLKITPTFTPTLTPTITLTPKSTLKSSPTSASTSTFMPTPTATKKGSPTATPKK